MARRRRQARVVLKIDPGRVRDELLLRLINGSTKAGVEPDQKKEENRRLARRPVNPDTE